jgi:uncharacterized protein YcbX
VEITHLFVYPVKSTRGIALDHAGLTLLGLEHDRRFMVVRPNGRFVTQRDIPQLALIETRLGADGIELSRTGKGSITVPFDGRDGEAISTRVWKDECKTIDQGDEISQWLTQALDSETPLRLVAMDPGFRRSLHQAERLGSESTVLFADAAPYLVTNQRSLERLNAELTDKGLDAVPMNRFRPNIVIRGLEAFAEHKVTGIASESYSLAFGYPCERCVVPTIDQETGEKHPQMQPYKTLAAINPMPDNPRAPAFGENAVLRSGAGETVSVGDRLVVDFR